ncbi:immunity 49 family protein [Nocardia sp. NPDC059240]|uniref:immunity 49 family protein n=1 Tax=Nocardia sp. NPDC059240 TaxID=3346786 RepID=UPI0036A8CE19
MTTRAAARHHLEILDQEGEQERISHGIEHHLTRAEKHPRRFKDILHASMRLAGLRSAIDPTARKVETWQAYVQVMQASSAIFAIAGKADGMIEVRYADRTLTLPAGATRGIADAGNWVTAFFFAIMGRDQARLDMLCDVPIDLLRTSGSVYDEYIYHWVDTLQTYWSEGSDIGAKLRAAFEGTDPANARYAPPDLMLQLLYPPIDLFYRFLAEQHEEFNNGLAQALQLHDTFWDSDHDDRRDDRDGMIAAGPLAMTCLAYDAGLSIDVESDYLPRHIVQRSWLGEFPT